MSRTTVESGRADAAAAEEVARLRRALGEATESQAKLRSVLDRLTSPPLFPAVLLAIEATPEGGRALVAEAAARRVVAIGSAVDAGTLFIGGGVLLGPERNAIVAHCPWPLPPSDTGTFERPAGDGRLIIRQRDEEVVATAAHALDADALRSGDSVLWDRRSGLVYGRIDGSNGEGSFVETTPEETFESIGGLDRQIDEVRREILLHREHPDIVRRYRLPRKGSVLLYGPPGNGKTLIARALANWVATLGRSGKSRFMHIKPGALHSMWYAQSEANYRTAFRVAREAAERDPDSPVVMFFDEVDAIGIARGGAGGHHVDDRVLTAFMTELDGLDARRDILVVAATNRRDVLDPALLRPGRLGDLPLEVPRPTARAAEAIFRRHLPEDLPFAGATRGHACTTARDEVVACAVSRLYAPNGIGVVATIRFRDGKEREIEARELVSGAMFAQIARRATERACVRELRGETGGLRLADVLDCVEEQMDAAAGVLRPANCRAWIDDLAQDGDVVRVIPRERRAARAHRYLELAPA